MRLCANENVPGECVARLRQRGHDVLWIREVARGSGDDAVLDREEAEAGCAGDYGPPTPLRRSRRKASAKSLPSAVKKGAKQ